MEQLLYKFHLYISNDIDFIQFFVTYPYCITIHKCVKRVTIYQLHNNYIFSNIKNKKPCSIKIEREDKYWQVPNNLDFFPQETSILTQMKNIDFFQDN